LFIVCAIPAGTTAGTRRERKQGLEQFTLDIRPDIGINMTGIHARPGCILAAVRNYNRMEHLESVLEKTNMRRHDIVVMTVRNVSTGAGEYDLDENKLFTDDERELFTSVYDLDTKTERT